MGQLAKKGWPKCIAVYDVVKLKKCASKKLTKMELKVFFSILFILIPELKEHIGPSVRQPTKDLKFSIYTIGYKCLVSASKSMSIIYLYHMVVADHKNHYLFSF